MQLDISPEAAAFVAANGGCLWVWAARPRMCCSGSPAWMHASIEPPAGLANGLAGFAALPAASGPEGLQVLFRPAAGQFPDVLEIGLQGRRHPKIAAYWDGCLMAMA